jgi:hypothetical protein
MMFIVSFSIHIGYIVNVNINVNVWVYFCPNPGSAVILIVYK